MSRAGFKRRSFEISKRLVFEAWKRVRANRGAPGVDRQSIADFEGDEGNLLYKLWSVCSEC
jgi:RNA-directed DNA polymerase